MARSIGPRSFFTRPTGSRSEKVKQAIERAASCVARGHGITPAGRFGAPKIHQRYLEKRGATSCHI